MGIKIVTDSNCDLSLKFLDENKDIVTLLPCPVTMSTGEEIMDDFGRTYDLRKFYNDVRGGLRSKTSMVTSNRFEEFFTEMTGKQHEVLYLAFSGPLAGVLAGGTLAAQQVKGRDPNAVIQVVDTRSASIGLGQCIAIATDMIKKGHKIGEIVEHIESIKMNVNHWFGVDDLIFLKEGGRVSALTAMVGTALKVKPILTLDRSGMIVPAAKTRGRKKMIHDLAQKAIDLYDREYGSRIVIGNGDCEEDGLELEAQIKAEIPHAEYVQVMTRMTIATHLGPSSLSLSFVGKERAE